MTESKQASAGDTVLIHYTGRLSDGTVFDSSRGRDPLAFQLGAGMVIVGFERAVSGMRIGESKTEKIPAADAYGAPREELRFAFPRDRLPEGLDPKVGETLEMQDAQGNGARVVVINATPEKLVLDANHPLAGKDLTFDIELVGIQ